MDLNQNNTGAGTILFVVLTLLGVALIQVSRSGTSVKSFQIKLFLSAIIIRFISSLSIYEYGLSSIVGDEDSSGYFMGQYYGGTWLSYNYSVLDLPRLWIPAFEEHHRGYYYLVGTLFFLTGWTGRIPPAALNCFFGALTVIVTYRITLCLFSAWTAKRVGWLACFIPSLIIWSSQTLKEPVIIFLETIGLYACVRLRMQGFSIKYILLCVISIFALYPFRFYASLVTAVAVFVTILLPEIGKRAKSGPMAGVIIVILIFPLAVSTGLIARTESQLEEYDLSRVQQFRSDVSVGQGSGVVSDYNLNTTSGFTLATIVGALHLLLAPFPWQLGGSLRMVFTLPEMLFWWWLFIFGLIPGTKFIIKSRLFDVLPLIIFILLLGLLYSITFGNVGLVFRQRAQILPWLIIFAVVGLEYRKYKSNFRMVHQF